MNKWYKNTSELVGPLLVVEGIDQPVYEEIVEIKSDSGEIKLGRVLEAHAGKAVIQVFDSTVGLDLDSAVVNFSGQTLKAKLSEDMLGRVFNGLGQAKDGGPEIEAESFADINGSAINPAVREFPDDFIQTGISAIDVMTTIVQGQKIPIFSIFGLPHNELAAQIVRQAEVIKDGVADSNFTIVFGAIGVTFEEYQFFISEFEKAGALDKTTMFVNLANDPIVERITLPRYALTYAEYLAFEKNKNVLVIMSDITNYCSALREISAARKEVPGQRSYPGYMYTDLASLYERAGRVEGSSGSITQLPILTMPEGDKTHPIPDLTGYITEGQITLSDSLSKQGIKPPIDVLASLSRMMGKGIGKGKTREDHPKVSDQLFALYSKGLELIELSRILGESSLSETEQKYIKFVKEFEDKFLNQGFNNKRSLEESLDIAWSLFKIIPFTELKKLKKEDIEKYIPNE